MVGGLAGGGEHGEAAAALGVHDDGEPAVLLEVAGAPPEPLGHRVAEVLVGFGAGDEEARLEPGLLQPAQALVGLVEDGVSVGVKIGVTHGLQGVWHRDGERRGVFRTPCAGILREHHRLPMQHHALTFTTPDGLDLAGRVWHPDFGARGAVLVVHGLGEHSGRYAAFASRLLAAGYAVYAYDHRGHGQSEGERGMVGQFDDYIGDLYAVLHSIRLDAGQRLGAGRPLFLFGQSMGGLIAATYVDRHGPDGFAGLILSAPALRLPDTTAPFLRPVAPLLVRLFPRLVVDKLNLDHLSRDPVVGRTYAADPLTDARVRARLGFEVLQASEELRQSDAANFTLPLLLLHGEADQITDPDGTRWLYEHAPTEDKKLLLYANGRHEPHNDLQKEAVYESLIGWLDRHA